MPEIGGVEYGDEAFEHMRRLAADIDAAEPGEEKLRLVNEAEVLHQFHVTFPGVKMLPDEAPAPTPEPEAPSLFDEPAHPSQRPGRFYGHDATETERASGEQKELEDLGPLRPNTLAHKVLAVYGDGRRRTAYDASMELTGDGHAKRRESRRLHDRGFLRKNGTLPNRAPDGRDHVDAYEITAAGQGELVRLAAL